MTSHSNLSAVVVEAIVLVVILVSLGMLRWNVREERARRDMSDLIYTLRKAGVSGRKVGCNCGARGKLDGMAG
jgi:hypothetical protein